MSKREWTVYHLFVLFTLEYQRLKVSSYVEVEDGTPEDPPCTIASPEMKFSVNNTELTVGSNFLQDGERAWIGYTREQKQFQYLGCISSEDAISPDEIDNVEFSTVLDLGICYYVCSVLNMPVFGMQGGADNPCKCFRAEIKEREAKSINCNVKCTDVNFRCGGQRHISLYEHVDLVKAEISYSGLDRCLSTNKLKYYWRNCNEQLGTICQKDMNTKYEFPRAIWVDSSTVCFRKDMVPMIYRRRAPDSFWRHFWIAVLQTTAVRNASKWQSERDMMFGYVERTGDTYVLAFTRDRHVTKKVLCLKDDEEMVNLTTESIHTVSTVLDEEMVFTWSSRESNFTVIDQVPLLQMTGKGKSTKVAFYVGVPVGILLIIGIIVFIILIRNRRLNPRTSKSQNYDGENGVAFNRQEEVTLYQENEYDLYYDAEEGGACSQYQDVDYEDKSDNINNDMDVYEIPNAEDTFESEYDGEARENQYDIYEAPNEDQSEDYVNSGAVERGNIGYLDDKSKSLSLSASNYFVLEKERKQSKDDIDMEPDSKTSRAYNHVKISSSFGSGGDNIDEYDHIVHVSGPTANRKDYNTTLISQDQLNSFDTNVPVQLNDEYTNYHNNGIKESFKVFYKQKMS